MDIIAIREVTCYKLLFMNNKITTSSFSTKGTRNTHSKRWSTTNFQNCDLDLNSNVSLKYAILIENKKFLFEKFLAEINNSVKSMGLNLSILFQEKIDTVKFNRGTSDTRSELIFRTVIQDKIGHSFIDENEVPELGSNFFLELLRTINNRIASAEYNFKLLGNKRKEFNRNLNVKFSSECSGFLFHETLGHMLEEDFGGINPSFYKIKLPAFLNYYDNPFLFKGMLGLNLLDDTGCSVKAAKLIHEGKIINKISSKSGFGFMRAQEIKDEPLPRMRTTFIQNNISSTIPDKTEYVVMNKIYSGFIIPTTMDIFLNGIGMYRRNNEDASYLPSISIKTNLLEIVNNIDFLGTENSYQMAYCVKKGQVIRVGVGGPTINVNNLQVRGEEYV